MRRAAPALIATAGALGVLATFHSAPVKATHVAASGAPPPAAGTASTTPATSSGTVESTTTPTTAATTRAVTGPDIGTRYGDVQVQVVLQGQRMIEVRSIRLPFDRSRSQRISDFAAPRLRAEALRAQSAAIDLVSGATYTSEGYVQSLQGALDRARG
jgi:uncharacterized protein with FMN-binding domain